MTTASRPAGVYAQIARAPASGADGLGIWGELAALVDPAEWRPTLAPDIEVKRFRLRWGNDYAMIANPRELIHYRLEPYEVELLPLMDGEHTVKQILVERFRGSGDMELSGLADLVQQLHTGGVLAAPYVDVADAVRRGLDPVSTVRRKVRQFARSLSVDWRGAHRMVAFSYRHGVRWFFMPWVAIAMGLAAFVGFLAFLAVPDTDRFDLS
ncbi:MAG: hypothetical protein ACXWWQ_06190, partial [Candidatus Limnocylindria bacterium]